MKPLMNYTKKILLNGGLFIIVIFLTYHFVISKINFNNTIHLLYSFNRFYLTMAVLSVVIILSLETLTIKRNLYILGEKKHFFTCVKYTFAGNFFSTITPAATGGQPMQIYLMNKDNITTYKSTLALMMDLCAYQATIVCFSIIAFLMFFKEILRLFGSFYPLLFIGVALNTALLIITLLAMFSDKLIYALINFLAEILLICKYKKTSEFTEYSRNWVTNYKNSAALLGKNTIWLAGNFFLMFIRITLMFTAPIWVYLGLGLSGASWFFIMAMQSLLHISCAALPLPGGVGVGETTFLLCFSTIFPSSLIGTAMLFSRAIGFYSITIISGISLLFYCIFNIKKKVR